MTMPVHRACLSPSLVANNKSSPTLGRSSRGVIEVSGNPPACRGVSSASIAMAAVIATAKAAKTNCVRRLGPLD